MSAAKEKREDSGKCEACGVLGDYMCPDIPADRPGRAQDKMADEPTREP